MFAQGLQDLPHAPVHRFDLRSEHIAFGLIEQIFAHKVRAVGIGVRHVHEPAPHNPSAAAYHGNPRALVRAPQWSRTIGLCRAARILPSVPDFGLFTPLGKCPADPQFSPVSRNHGSSRVFPSFSIPTRPQLRNCCSPPRPLDLPAFPGLESGRGEKPISYPFSYPSDCPKTSANETLHRDSGVLQEALQDHSSGG
jgi:hypothetical protein